MPSLAVTVKRELRDRGKSERWKAGKGATPDGEEKEGTEKAAQLKSPEDLRG